MFWGVGKEGTKIAKTPLQYTAAVTALEMESARSRLRILLRKLGFLKRTLSDTATGVGAAAMESMLDDGAWLRNTGS